MTWEGLPGAVRWMLVAAAGLVVVSLVRIASGASDIDSSGALRAALISTVPIALAGLGGLWSERAGVVNIGLEGMLLAGALGAGVCTYHYGIVAGLLGGIAFGAIGGLVHAVATVLIGVDHIVSGVAINIISAGLCAFLASVFFADLPNGGPTQSPPLNSPPTITIGPLVDASRDVERHGWFVLSDLAGIVGALTRSLSLVTVLALLLFVLSFVVLWWTPFGLRLRSVGESPSAAESLGVNVYLYKVIAVVISGGLAGLAGAYLALVASSGYQNGMSNGIGYIGLAAMIFGNWRPLGLLMGALIFGYTTALQLRGGTESLHALLLVIGLFLLAVSVTMVVRDRVPAAAAPAALGVIAVLFLAYVLTDAAALLVGLAALALAAAAALGLARAISVRGAVSLVLGGVFTLWYATTDTIAANFAGMAPYVATLFVLAYAAQSLRMPAADGLIYRRGSTG
ncbi:ABC transporter permease [Nocardioides acrostichi]|uniref:ABC transporter permease n=1 Tax=Nocardioides acrostichi TaxID=2784339 RepID=A0A930UY17_9ACTN|nr:ABC transporter permease [Nocardioides acrostichi]MBF4161787.1 ABC transporter permease [Nocardioides acrostichi]